MRNKITNKSRLIIYLCVTILSASCKDIEIPEEFSQTVEIVSTLPVSTATAGIAPGTEITFTGVNVMNISKVMFGDFEATILSKKLFAIKVTVPAGNLIQEATTKLRLRIYDSINTEPIYESDFWVYVALKDTRITSHTPLTGVTIGDMITFGGNNLDKVKRILLNDISIGATDFLTQSNTKIEMRVPTKMSSALSPGLNEVKLSAVWDDNGTDETLVLNSAYKLVIPQVTVVNPHANPLKIGNEITFTGLYLDKVDSVYAGTVKTRIKKKTANLLTVVLLNGSCNNNTGNPIPLNFIGYYGFYKQQLGLLSNAYVDTTPIQEVDPPVVSDITAADGYYLKKEVVITGTNLSVVDEVIVGGLNAKILADRTNTQLKFLVPEDFTFNSPQECDIELSFGTASPTIVGSKVIYPFYYWKDLQIGAQGADKTIGNFFVPDSGKVFTPDEWYNKSIDIFARNFISGASTMNPCSAQNTLNKTLITSSDQYYSVPPYMLFTYTNSQIRIYNTSWSSAQFNLFKKADNTALSTKNLFGTPLVFFKVLGFNGAGGSDRAYADSVRAGTITCLSNNNVGVSTVKTAFVTNPLYVSSSTINSSFDANSVLLMQQVTYDWGKALTSSTPMTYVYKSGFIRVKSVTNPTSSSAVMTFDCYWPKNHR